MSDDLLPALRDYDRRERCASACICCGGTDLRKSPAVLMPFVAHRALGWAPVEIDASWGLRSVPAGHAMTVCNSVCCGDCGMLFLDIRFSPREMRALYHDYRGAAYTRLRESYEPGYLARNAVLDAAATYLPAVESFLEPLLPARPRVLDWGGDTGRNTPFASRAERVDIFDISDKPVLPGMRRVDAGTAAQAGYDLVVCSNVLEHVPYPADLIGALRTAMTRDTVLYVEVPYERLMRAHPGSRELHRAKRHWHEHVNFYSEEALRRLLVNCGLEVCASAVLEFASVSDAGAALQVAARRRAPRAQA